MESLKRRPQTYWKLCLLYLLAIIILTYPGIMSFASSAIGHPEASVGCHVWVIWWAQNHFGDFQNDLIFYPYGADIIQLYGSDLLSPLLFAWLPFSPVFLYNSWLFILLLVGALGMHTLLKYNENTDSQAFIAGLFFIAAPFFQHEILNGTSELLSTGFLPWFVYFWMRIFERPSSKDGWKIGIIAGILLTSSAYNPFFLLLFAMVFLAHRSCTQLSAIFPKGITLSIKSALLGFAPFFGITIWLQLQHGALETFSRRIDWLSLEQSLPDSYVNIDGWFNPSQRDFPVIMNLPDGGQFEYWTTCTPYLGIFAIIATLVGWRNFGRSKLKMMRWLLPISMLIAMGPYLRLNGNVLSIWNHPIPLPAATIAYLFPLFAITAIHAYRYTAVVVLCISTMAVQKLHSKWWILILAIEFLWLSPNPHPQPNTPIPKDSSTLQYLAKLPDGAVFTFPIAKENLHDLGQVLLAQTIHGKPVHDGGIHRRAGFQATQLFRDNYVVDELSMRWNMTFPSQMESKLTFQYLYHLGYRYILAPSDNMSAVEYGNGLWKEPTHQDAQWTLWTLPSD